MDKELLGLSLAAVYDGFGGRQFARLVQGISLQRPVIWLLTVELRSCVRVEVAVLGSRP